jgi:phosphoglycerate kinase
MKVFGLKNAKIKSGQKVLVRVDFNVPLKKGRISDDYKIKRTLPTLVYLKQAGAVLIVVSHLGRPKNRHDKSLSAKPLASALQKLLKTKVTFIIDPFSPAFKTQLNKAKPGTIFMLDNIRYYPEENKNDSAFAKKLAALADIYVNDAFADSHRAHATVNAIQFFLPSYAGFLLEEEVVNLRKIIKPIKPLVVIGGAKIDTKIGIISKMKKVAKYVLIGGALANDLLRAAGYEIGKSLVGDDKKAAKKVLGKNVILPLDAIVTNRKGKVEIKNVDEVEKDDKILDIGPRTICLFSNYIKKAKTIMWNGPLGMFEEPRFRQGTIAIAREIAYSSKYSSYTLVGGGETIEALKIAKAEKIVSWASTAGGAMIDYLSGQKMPGLIKIVKN